MKGPVETTLLLGDGERRRGAGVLLAAMVVGFCFVAALVGTGALRPTELLSSVNSVKTNGPVSGHNGMVLSGVIPGYHVDNIQNMGAHDVRMWNRAAKGVPEDGGRRHFKQKNGKQGSKPEKKLRHGRKKVVVRRQSEH